MATKTTTATPFPFPRDYSFPAFFSRQTNLSTLHAQHTKWAALVLSYCQHHRIFRLSLSSVAEMDLFYNRRLEKRLQLPDIKELLEFMRKEGRVENVGSGGDVVFVYWRKPEEWARTIEKFVEVTGQKGSVLTLYELAQGEGTRASEIHGIDHDVLLKALNVLVKRGKAQIFGQDDSQGVKFF